MFMMFRSLRTQSLLRFWQQGEPVVRPEKPESTPHGGCGAQGWRPGCRRLGPSEKARVTHRMLCTFPSTTALSSRAAWTPSGLQQKLLVEQRQVVLQFPWEVMRMPSPWCRTAAGLLCSQHLGGDSNQRAMAQSLALTPGSYTTNPTLHLPPLGYASYTYMLVRINPAPYLQDVLEAASSSVQPALLRTVHLGAFDDDVCGAGDSHPGPGC